MKTNFPLSLCQNLRPETRKLTEDQAEEQRRLQSEMPELTNGIILPWYSEKRGLTATGGDGGLNTFGTHIPDIGAGFRDAFVIEKLGARVWGGLKGNINAPRAKPGIVASWTSETVAQADGAELFATLPMTPQRVSAQITVSQQWLNQDPTAEIFLRTELGAALAEAVQGVSISGAGSGSNQPIGILATSGIGSVVGGTNGLAPTLSNVADLEFSVAGTARADRGHCAFLCSPKARRKLRQTFQNGTGSESVWLASEAYSLLGYGAGVTTAVPDTLTKGTSSGNCSAIIFGEMSELFVGLWGPGVIFEVVTSSAFAKAGQVLVVATAFVSTGVRSPEAFAVMADALC